LKVRAEDKGEPPTYADVEVELDVVDQKNKPPIWDSIVYGPKHIKENVPINTVVASVKARFVIEIYSKATQATCATQTVYIFNKLIQYEFTLQASLSYKLDVACM
jgi:hypothetical protein